MRFGKLNHVGVAVPSIEDGRARYAAFLGDEAVLETKDLPEHGITACFISTGNTVVELVAPLGESSPLHAFLEKRPDGGQHHLCFEVENVPAAVEALKAEGKRVLGEPRIGAHGTLVAFIHPKDMGGVLIEIIEAAHGEH